MAYRLSPEQPVSHQLVRILLEEVSSAALNLTEATADNRDGRVHEARKSIKKTRALLRLVAKGLGKARFQRENKRFCDINRQLSALRDAQAIIEAFAALPEDTVPQTARIKLLKRLESAKARTYLTLNVDEVLGASVAALNEAQLSLSSLTLKGEGYALLEAGLVKVYRQGRNALAIATQTPSPDNLHKFRKRVKDHWYHARLLSDANLKSFEGRQEALRELETHLGESHNLHVLQQTLRTRKSEKKVLVALRAREIELAGQALRIAEPLYATKPRQLKTDVSMLAELWPENRMQHRKADSKGSSREESFFRLKAALA